MVVSAHGLGIWIQYIPSKPWHQPVRLNGTIIWKTVISSAFTGMVGVVRYSRKLCYRYFFYVVSHVVTWWRAYTNIT
jgi:hypothetical protein